MRPLCRLCMTAALVLMVIAAAGQAPVSTQRVYLKPLPPPPEAAHAHPPDTRSGNAPCGYRGVTCPPSLFSAATGVASRNRGGSIGVGVGAFAEVPIWQLTANAARRVSEQLSSDGPQFPESLRMSDFQATGFAKGNWPVVIDYEAEPGAFVRLTVVTQNAPPAEAILEALQTGRRLQLLRLPAEFGSTVKSASFTLTATASATDATPRYLRIYGFGCGKKAVGSVAIDELRFGPRAITASQPDAHFGFHTHTTFDKMKAEFMQVALVNHSIEGQLFDNKKIDRRIAEGESVDDQWSAKKAHPGQIQFRVRGWMTVRSESDGGDWVSAFSPDLVYKK